MHLFKVCTENNAYVYVYAEDGLEALKVANGKLREYNFTKVDIILEPMVIVPEGFNE